MRGLVGLMHYYKRNLGDYAKKAGRLSMLQHGSYTLLIDACYDREKFPSLDEALEWTWASTTEEVEAVTFVLRKFFVLREGVYVQQRIEDELVDYQGKAVTNKRIADEREANRHASSTVRDEKRTNRVPVVNEPPPNHEPLTINQEPKEKKQRGSRLPIDFEFPDQWGEFCEKERPDLVPRKVFAGFKDFWIAKAGTGGVKLDWFATWRNWVRNQSANKQVPTFAQIKADVSRTTVPQNSDVEATLERVRADAAIPRHGPSLAVLAQMAAIRGHRIAA